MNDGLSDSTRALLEAARQGLAPDAAAVVRVRAKVAATTGGLLAGIGAKLLIMAVLGGLAGLGAAVIATRGRTEVSTPTVTMPQPATAEVAQVATARVEAPPAPVTQRKVAPVLVVVEHHADLAREVALIDAAMTALKGDPAQALATVQIYDTETAGHGQLAEDAAAIAIEARCALHAPDAVAKLAGFDARWPTSAQRARLTEACR